MKPLGTVVERVVWAIWLGSGVFLAAVAAPAAFRMSPTSTAAAGVVGAMLSRWHWIGTLAPLVLVILLVRRRSRGTFRTLVGVAILAAGLQWMIDSRISAIRSSSPVPISELERSDPIRRRFGMMHGISSSLLLVQVLLAAGVAFEKSP